ncbi:MAG: transporter substrate-binding domain-containing protein [Silicimonas sp.]|nr:transporter substrate-binding domain-containing protein [Silicimonas sp.]
MQNLAVAIIVLIIALMSGPERVEAQEACEVYRVKRGDTLRKISRRVFGYENFRSIYRENAAEIGRNPNLIRVGMVLRMPCPEGAAKPESDPIGQAEISFVTANGYLPYTDESLGNRGLFTHLVSKAMLRAAPEKPFEIVFVNDWSAHLETLLPKLAFDASFPWTRPGCETQGELTSVELYACQNYVYSDPFYEIVDGFFSRNGTGFDTVIDAKGLKGSTICRPEGYPTGHLEELGLMPPEVTLIQPTTSYACFDQLMRGKADLVALDTRAGERVLQDLGLSFKVAENPHLFSIQPLRVALHKSNPKSEELISVLNAGLKIMLESGEWSSIVTEGLQEQVGALVN